MRRVNITGAVTLIRTKDLEHLLNELTRLKEIERLQLVAAKTRSRQEAPTARVVRSVETAPTREL